jgi:hypothetical protein
LIAYAGRERERERIFWKRKEQIEIEIMEENEGEMKSIYNGTQFS